MEPGEPGGKYEEFACGQDVEKAGTLGLGVQNSVRKLLGGDSCTVPSMLLL